MATTLPQMVISAVLDAHDAAKGPIPPRPCYQAIYDAVKRGRKPGTCFDTGQPMTVSAEDQYGRWCQSCCDAGSVEPCASF